MTSATLVPTASQTVGPFVEIGCKYLETDRVAGPAAGLVNVTVRGRVLDGDGEMVPDYMLEIWQTTDTAGTALDGQRSLRRFATQDDSLGVIPPVILSPPPVILSPPPVILSEAKDRSRATDVSFARVMPLADGSFVFHTAYDPSHAGESASHLAMLVFMRGLLKPLYTRMYFPDDAHNDADPVLALVPDDRRATLVAVRESETNGSLALEWNIVLQGAGETVFFEW